MKGLSENLCSGTLISCQVTKEISWFIFHSELNLKHQMVLKHHFPPCKTAGLWLQFYHQHFYAQYAVPDRNGCHLSYVQREYANEATKICSLTQSRFKWISQKFVLRRDFPSLSCFLYDEHTAGTHLNIWKLKNLDCWGNAELVIYQCWLETVFFQSDKQESIHIVPHNCKKSDIAKIRQILSKLLKAAKWAISWKQNRTV